MACANLSMILDKIPERAYLYRIVKSNNESSTHH